MASSPAAIVLSRTASDIGARTRFDPKALLKLFRGLEEEFRAVATDDCESDDDHQDASARLIEVTKLADQVDAYYEELARPHLDELARLRTLVAPFKEITKLGTAAYRGVVSRWLVAKAKLEADAAAKAAEAARSRQPKALAAALNDKREAQVVKADGVGTRLVWKVKRIVDAKKVPDDFKSVVVASIERHVAKHPTNPNKPPVVAGVEFELQGALRVSR